MPAQIVSLSGGKDSTAMLLRLLEEGERIDDVVFFDGGWEFPQMYEHLNRLEEYTAMKITRLSPPFPLEYYMMENTRTRGNRVNDTIGYGWPGIGMRWCTTMKTQAITRHCRQFGDYVHLIGIAADERKRLRPDPKKRYPLAEWGMTESDCLEYCYRRGFDWGGLYEHFKRVSCFCCPLQNMRDLENLRTYYPELWNRMLDMDAEARRRGFTRTFRPGCSLQELERAFARKDNQMALFGGGE